jgi:hypothetical protein
MPQVPTYSLNYAQDGLDSLGAHALLAVAFVLILAGSAVLRGAARCCAVLRGAARCSAVLRRRTSAANGLVIVGTVSSTVAWRQDEIPPMHFLAVDIALCYFAATQPRRSSLTAPPQRSAHSPATSSCG